MGASPCRCRCDAAQNFQTTIVELSMEDGEDDQAFPREDSAVSSDTSAAGPALDHDGSVTPRRYSGLHAMSDPMNPAMANGEPSPPSRGAGRAPAMGLPSAVANLGLSPSRDHAAISRQQAYPQIHPIAPIGSRGGDPDQWGALAENERVSGSGRPQGPFTFKSAEELKKEAQSPSGPGTERSGFVSDRSSFISERSIDRSSKARTGDRYLGAAKAREILETLPSRSGPPVGREPSGLHAMTRSR